MIKKLQALSVVLLVFSIFAFFGEPRGEAKSPSEDVIEQAFSKAKSDYLALKVDKKRRLYRDNWIGVAERFEAVARKYPKAKRAPDAIFNAARLYSDLYLVSLAERDRQASLDAWERLYTNYPKSTLADDAHFERGQLCLRGRTPDFECARREFRNASEMKGDMAKEAKKSLDQLPPPPKAVAKQGANPASKSSTSSRERDQAQDRRASLSASIARASSGYGESKSPAQVAVTSPHKANSDTPPKKAETPSTDSGENLVDSSQMAAAIGKASLSGIPLSVQMGMKIRRVILDAGHGGYDTGAIGKGGTREKDVTLSVAIKLKKALLAQGYDVKLTREKDEFVALEERARFANRNNGDLFVSIHCNAAENRKLSGVETYTLNVASDRYSMRLAALENKTSGLGVSDLQLVLADLARKANQAESIQLAKAIHPSIVVAMRDGKKAARDHGLKQALFYVLLGVRMPSVLVEMGFISNDREEAILKSPERQEKMAQSMAKGIAKFMEARNALVNRDAVSSSPSAWKASDSPKASTSKSAVKSGKATPPKKASATKSGTASAAKKSSKK